MRSTDTGRRLQTVEISLDVIDVIQELGGATIAEIASELELAESTVHGHVRTLEHNEYLIKENGEYHLGATFLNKGGAVKNRRKEYQLIGDCVEKLAEETGERAQFIVEEHGKGTYLHMATGDDAVHIDARLGKQSLLHHSAAGKAILSQYPRDQVAEIIDRWGMPQTTENTITRRDELFEELERTHEHRYALNMEESIEGLRAVGSAVGTEDEVLGAISISGPTFRMKGDWLEEEIPDIIRGVTNEINLNIKYM